MAITLITKQFIKENNEPDEINKKIQTNNSLIILVSSKHLSFKLSCVRYLQRIVQVGFNWLWTVYKI